MARPVSIPDTALPGIPGDLIERLLTEQIAETLPPIITRLARHLVGILTIDQAAELLQCANRRAFRTLAADLGIPLIEISRERVFVQTSDIQRALRRHKRKLPTSGAPTVITRIPSAA